MKQGVDELSCEPLEGKYFKCLNYKQGLKKGGWAKEHP
jgi:hypothetical protein